jgi:hypothetical protein
MNLHLIEIGLERFSRIDLVSTFCIQDPIPDECSGLSRVLRVMNSDMDELFTRLNFRFMGYRSFIDVTDLTEAPSGNVDKVLLSDLDSFHVKRLTNILTCD